MESYLTTEEFVAYINTLRRNKKNSWYVYTGYVNDKFVEVKGFNTWLQILRVDHVTFPTIMDCSVLEFKNQLMEAVQ